MFSSSLRHAFLLTAAILQLTNAADSAVAEPCTIHISASGSSYDLRPLQLIPVDWSKPMKSQVAGATNESYHVRGYDYPSNFTLNLCGPVVEAANLTDVEGLTKKQYANVSAYYKDESGDTYSLGNANSAILFRGRKLVLNYTQGSICPELDEDGDPIEKRSPKIIGGSTARKAATRRKSTLLSFICDTTMSLTAHPTISFVGSLDHCSYFFEVRSRWACPGATPSKESGTLGPGAVFAVILGIAIAVYIVGGVVYQRNVMHQRGWRQLPNYSVWAGIFGFLSDMAVILFSSCGRCMPGINRLIGGKRGGYHRVGDNSRVSGPNGNIGRHRTPEDENRLIDQLDEEWD